MKFFEEIFKNMTGKGLTALCVLMFIMMILTVVGTIKTITNDCESKSSFTMLGETYKCTKVDKN